MTSNAFKAAEFLGKSIDDELFNINSKGNFEVGKNFQDLNIPVSVYKSLDLQGFDGQSIKINRLLGNFTSTAAIVLTPTVTAGKTVYITGDLYCGNEKVSLDLYYNDGDIYINKFDTNADFKLIQVKSNNVNYFALLYTTTTNSTSIESRFNGRVSNDILFDLITDTSVLELATPISTSSKIFEQMPAAPVPFSQAGACVLSNGNLLVVGGAGSQVFKGATTVADLNSNQSWMYSWKTKVWKQVANFPESVTTFTLVPLNGNRAIASSFSKLSSASVSVPVQRQYIYNADLDTWARTVDFIPQTNSTVNGTIMNGTTLTNYGAAAIYNVVYLNGIYWALGYDSINSTALVASGNMNADGSITWTRRISTAATYASWDMTYNDTLKLYIATVNGHVNTSPDGITWTQRTIPGTVGSLYGIISNGNMTIVAGDSGRIATTTDGITWTQRTISTGNQIFGLAYGNGVYVASGVDTAGTTGRLWTSPDGITWTQRVSPITGIYRGVIFDGTKFIAIAYLSDIVTSIDGITWTVATSALNNGTNVCHRMSYRDGKYVLGITIGMNNASYAISTDLVNWTLYNPGGSGGIGRIYGLTWTADNRILLAQAHGANGTGQVFLTAPNPVKTVDAQVIPANIASIEISPNKLIMVGTDPAWRTGNSGTTQALNAIAYGIGIYVVVGLNGTVLRSTDLVNWSLINIGSAVNMWSVIYACGKFILGGDNGVIYTSADAITWTARTSGTTDPIKSIQYGDNATNDFFVACTGLGKIFTSPDGITWTARTSGVTTSLRQIAFKNQTFVAVGDNGVILTSYLASGTTWNPQISGTTATLLYVELINNLYIACGIGGVLLTSADGITWTQRTFPTTDTLRGVVYANGIYTVTNSQGVNYYSTDLVTWKSTVSANSAYAMLRTTYVNGTYISVGEGGSIKFTVDPYALSNTLQLDLSNNTYTKKAKAPLLDGSSLPQMVKDTNYVYLSHKNGVYRYSIANDIWEVMPSFPSSIASSVVTRLNTSVKMVLSNSKLLVTNITSFNTFIYEYDLSKGLNGTWIIKNTMPGITATLVMAMVKLVDGRVGILLNATKDLALVNDYAYAFTAYNHSADVLDKTIFDTIVPKTIPPRTFCAPTVFNLSADEVFVTGNYWTGLAAGPNTDYLDILKEVYKYTISTDTWTRLADFPTGTSDRTDPIYTQYRTTNGSCFGHGISLNADEFLVTAGNRLILQRADGSSSAYQAFPEQSDEVYIYNKTANTFTANAPRATYGQMKGTHLGKLMRTPANEIILIGGIYREPYPAVANNVTTPDIYVFNTTTKLWSTWLTLPFDTGFAAIVQNKLDPNLVYICAPVRSFASGGADTANASSTVYELNLTTKLTRSIGAVPINPTFIKSGFFNSANNSIVLAQTVRGGSIVGQFVDALIEFFIDTGDFKLASILPKDMLVTTDNRTSGYYAQSFDVGNNTILNFSSLFSNNMSITKPNVVQYRGKLTRLPSQIQTISNGGSSARSRVKDVDTALVVGGYTGRGADFDNITIRTSPTVSSAFYYGIAFGNGMFVATGDNGVIVSSPDGITWTTRSSGTTNPLRSVIFAGNQFVIVGYGAKILTSPDGITWTSRTNSLSLDLIAITHNGSFFVAMTYTGAPATSLDGINWTNRTGSGTNATVHGLAVGNGIFVGLGAANTGSTSTDGVTWTARTPGTTTFINSVIFGGGQFLAVGESGSIYTSTNGINWTARTSGTTVGLNRSIYQNGTFIVVGNGGTILTSPDGITWTNKSTLVSNLTAGLAVGLYWGVTYSPALEMFVFAGQPITLGTGGLIATARNLNTNITSVNLRNGKVSKVVQFPNNLELYGANITNLGDDRFLITGRKGYCAIDSEVMLSGDNTSPVFIYDYLENSFTQKNNMPWMAYNRTKGVFLGSKSFVENGLVYSVKTVVPVATPLLAIVTYNPVTDTWVKLLEAGTGWYDSLSYVGNFSIGRVYIGTRSGTNGFQFFKFNTTTNALDTISNVITGRPNHLGAIKTDDNTIVIPFFVNSADSYKPYGYYYKYDILNNTGSNINYSAEELLLLPATFGDSMNYETDTDGSTYFFNFSQWSANAFNRCATDIVSLS